MNKVIHFVGLTFLLLASAGMGANDPNSPYQETLHKADAGDPKAQCSLGFISFFSDEETLYKVEAGDPQAQYYLGLWCLYVVVPLDSSIDESQRYPEAVKWYTKAAQQGDADAQCRLGLMYANGRGVPQDYVQAYKWLNLAAA